MMQNPYVGPRAFQIGEKLPAREREEWELTDLLIAERIVLLHAPSGAGKTSLLQAGVTPLLRAERLGEKRFAPTIPLRVKTPPPAHRQVHNRYVYSIALDLLGGTSDPADLESLTLPDLLARAAKNADSEILVLMFDQFEEILTLDQADRASQRMFFEELGTVLADGSVWAVFAMREDFIGGLERYLHNFPDHLQTRYRLDFLDIAAARVAIQAPARDEGVTFSDEAVEMLLSRLNRVRVQRPGNRVEELAAPFVVPFQLQVVCRQLWNVVGRYKRSEFHSIDVADVRRHGNVGRVLRGYYSDTVTAVAEATGADVRVIREWFESQLITREKWRNQTLTGPESGDADPQHILRALADAYLLRSDTRAGVSWYELSHDQLIQPILDDNAAWRRTHLEPWQLTAGEWRSTHREELLLTGADLQAAQQSAQTGTVTEWEREFLDDSLHQQQQLSLAQRYRNATSMRGMLLLLAFVELLVIVALLMLLLVVVR
jgi:hypothetical protein